MSARQMVKPLLALACLLLSALHLKGATDKQIASSDFDLLVSQLRREPPSREISRKDVQRAIRGLIASPVWLNLERTDVDYILKIGIGSYIVNGSGFCATCHTWKGVGTTRAEGGGPWLPGGDPFRGQPKRINVDEYMSGGRSLQEQGGVFTSRNLTPDPANGLPGRPGMTEEEFIDVMRTGLDRRDQGLLLMQWPDYINMTDFDLKAIYAYLRAIPSVAKDIPDSPKVP